VLLVDLGFFIVAFRAAHGFNLFAVRLGGRWVDVLHRDGLVAVRAVHAGVHGLGEKLRRRPQEAGVWAAVVTVGAAVHLGLLRQRR
jgi:hypothetical protein